MKREDEIERGVNALLSCGRIEEAAHQCGVSRTTFWRLAQKPEFQTRLHEARLQLSREIVNSLQANALDAVSALREVMQNERTPPSTKVSAAGKLIELSFRAKEQLEMEERVAALEATLKRR
jgi:DNA-binding MurR/RpiR family transcriptional regulator